MKRRHPLPPPLAPLYTLFRLGRYRAVFNPRYNPYTRDICKRVACASYDIKRIEWFSSYSHLLLNNDVILRVSRVPSLLSFHK